MKLPLPSTRLLIALGAGLIVVAFFRASVGGIIVGALVGGFTYLLAKWSGVR